MKSRFKKMLSLALTLVLAVSLFPVAAFGATVASGTCGSNLNWTLDSDGKLTVSGSGAMDDYDPWGNTDPSPWNAYRDDIKTVSVGNGVTGIGKMAFMFCDNLTTVTLPASVRSIGVSAFNDCDSLTAVALPANLTKIENAVFCDCKSLASVSIPNGVTSIGDSAFSGCTVLNNLTLPTGLRSIGNYAFNSCNGLTQITIPAGVNEFGTYAFHNCNSLARVTLSPGVSALGTYAFYGCTALTSVTIPDSITSLPAYAFWDCSALDGVTLPAGLTSIGVGAFRGCSSLSGLTIPDGVTKIEEFTFSECANMTSVKIPANVTSIGRSAFMYCMSLQEVTIPDSATELGSQAFESCRSLTDLHIGAGLTTIPYRAFDDCRSLEEVTIPENITEIGSEAFRGCTSLQTVSLPDNLTTIGGYAFDKCTALDGIVIPDGVTTIGGNAFIECTSLREIVIPDSMTSIASGTFSGCTALSDITVPETVTEIGQKAFRNTAWFNALPDGVVYMNNIACDYKGTKSELTSVELREGTTSVSDSIFWNCANLSSVTLPDTVAFIGPYAFGKCTSLTSVVIPDSCVTIKNNCFEGCTALTKILLPDSLQELGANIFLSDSRLIAYVFADSAALQYCTDNNVRRQIVSVADEAVSWSWSEAFDAAAVTLSVTPGSFTVVSTANGDEITSETTEPTHTQNGSVRYTASVAYGGKSFSDTREKTLYATGHEYDYANAVFNWDGYACETATATCPDDGATVDVDVTVSSETPVTPDCTNGGEAVYTASFTVGEDTYTDTKTEILEATGHLHTETVPETASTCVAHGYTAGMYCNDCKQYISGHEEKPLVGHTWSETGTVTKPATCVSMGDRLYTCTVPGCGATDTRTDVAIDPDHHLNTAEEGETASSCTAHGYTAGVFCSDCETWVSGHTEKPLAEHSWQETERVNANCRDEGYVDYVCAVENCGKTKREVLEIDPDAHDFKVTVYPPTCTDKGYTSHTCTLCRYGYNDEQVDALGHEWSDPVWSWNGTSSATATFTCANGDHPQTVTATITVETAKEPTETEKGKNVYTATVEFEGNTYTDTVEKTIPALNDGLCKWCGEDHSGSFWQKLVGFFHSILYFFAHLFGRR